MLYKWYRVRFLKSFRKTIAQSDLNMDKWLHTSPSNDLELQCSDHCRFLQPCSVNWTPLTTRFAPEIFLSIYLDSRWSKEILAWWGGSTSLSSSIICNSCKTLLLRATSYTCNTASYSATCSLFREPVHFGFWRDGMCFTKLKQVILFLSTSMNHLVFVPKFGKKLSHQVYWPSEKKKLINSVGDLSKNSVGICKCSDPSYWRLEERSKIN